MKLLFPTLFFCLCLSITSFGQDAKKARSIFQEISIKEQISIDFNGSNYSLSALQNLKQDLEMYEEKILKVYLNESSKEMKITYNGFMQRYDFENAFSKNGMSFYRPQTTSVQAVKSEKE